MEDFALRKRVEQIGCSLSLLEERIKELENSLEEMRKLMYNILTETEKEINDGK